MDDSEDNMSAEDVTKVDSPATFRSKPKKRSLVERELETNLTARVTSPVSNGEGTSTSRYGRARRLKTESDHNDTKKMVVEVFKSSGPETSPVKVQSPVYKMHASNSPIRLESPKKHSDVYLDPQIESIYQENISLSRFGAEEKLKPSPGKKLPKIYIRKDLIQSRDPEETVMLIKNIFSPTKSAQKSTNSHLSNILERSSEKFSINSDEKLSNGHINNASVVKTLDFDSKKKKKENKEKLLSKSDLFELEAKCLYQVGDLAWARMGTYPFWPCIVTRDPSNGIFVKKKLFGRIERDIIHVTFFGDNGRRGWIVDNMLQRFKGLAEFESAREKFTPEDKKRDPRLYAAFFISEKKQLLWNMSVHEAETLLKEPKRLRIDILNDMLEKARCQKATPKTQKSGKISRTDSDVSLSESLYDSLFSEDDGKNDDSDRLRNKIRNKSLDVSEVVTACLDNMAAKTGITKIQRQSHMDRWLQKAKSKTPEKTHLKPCISIKDNKSICKQEHSKKKKRVSSKDVSMKPYSLRRSTQHESQNLLAYQNEHDYSKIVSNDFEENLISARVKHRNKGSTMSVPTQIESLDIEEEDDVKSTYYDGDRASKNSVSAKHESYEKQKEINDVHVTYDKDGDRTVSIPAKLELLENDKEKNNHNAAYYDTYEKRTRSLSAEIESYENEMKDDNMTYDTDETSTVKESLENDKKNIDTEVNTISKADTVKVKEIVINHETSTIIESDAGNQTSSDETKNVLFRDFPDLDVNTSSDTQDSYFSTEKTTETGTSDTDTQSHTDTSITYNNTEDKSEFNARSCFSVDSENDTLCLSIQDKKQSKFEEKIIGNKDFDCLDDSMDSTYTDISNKMDNDTITPNENQRIGKKESIHSLNLQLGTEFNLGSIVHSKNIDNIIKKLSVSEDIDKEFMNINSNNVTEYDDKDIDRDTSTSDTFITMGEPEDTIQTNLVCENVTKEEKTISDNSAICFQNGNFNNLIYDVGEKRREQENILNTKGNQPEDGNTVNTASDNDTTIEIPYKNEDSVSDLINEDLHKDPKTGEDITNGCNNAICEKLDVYAAASNSIIETDHVASEEVNLSKSNNYFNDVNLVDIKNRTYNDHVQENGHHDYDTDLRDEDFDIETASVSSEDSQISVTRSRLRLQLKRNKEPKPSVMDDPEFLKYVETRRDSLMDEHPELSSDEIIVYLHKTWLYKDTNKTDLKKSDDIDHSSFVKGLHEPVRKKTSVRRTKKIKESNKKRDITERKIISVNSEKYREITSKMPVVVIETKVPEENKEISPINIDAIVVNNTEVEIPQSGSIAKSVDNDINLVQSETIVKRVNSSTCLENADIDSNKLISDHTMPSSPYQDTKHTKDNDGTSLEATVKEELDIDAASIDSEASDIPLIYSKLRLRAKAESMKNKNIDQDANNVEVDNVSVSSEDSDMLISKRKQKIKLERKTEKNIEDPEFIKYLELRQDTLTDENPQLTQEEITNYLFKTWLYEEEAKHQLKKTDDIAQSALVKGLNDERLETAPNRRVKKKVKIPKEITDFFEVAAREKPKRQIIKPFYNEEFYDFEDQIESFEITKNKEEIKTEMNVLNSEKPIACSSVDGDFSKDHDEENYIDEVELYFSELTKPKPNVFKGLVREKVCDICERTENLVKCKTCHGTFHIDCVKKQGEIVEVPVPTRGRKKKKKAGRRPKGSEDVDNHSDDKIQDLSEENIEDLEPESHTVDADFLEAQLSVKMKEVLDNLVPPEIYSYSSDEEVNWNDSVPGKCEIVDVKLKLRTTEVLDFSDFKCNNCEKYDTPICFVCKSAISKKESKMRQRCQVAHCHKYYHIDCLEHWPQTQFNGGEPSRNNKKINEYFEALTCPRHVCHTCVSDDPRGCKTRFSGDKLAKCVRCPATYHSFTKCIPAGTKILTASHIICPRHYEHSPGKVPCHVNTGWCFICALGGSLICCEYCPTSFHAECLNIDPPEGGYMCEDCETGRLPLYGEMVWVKLGHYRWWPGIILHPSEIPLNILAVKHRLGEFVVRFFGQYDHYWVNRGRVFPFQEGDSGRISSQKSKIDAAFTMAMEHAQRACEILKSAEPNQEESLDIASSLLPPHYVKLKVNKPCGSLCGRKLDDPELSLTQCECNPDEEDPCGLYSQCLNRMLLTECGPTCRAGDRCNNRAFEKRLYPKLVPYRTPHRGWGLKTLEDIKAGQFVIEYVGELIDEEEFKRRMRRKHEIRDENFYFLTLDKERMIDAGPKGNLARFMNHCCEPNCETQKWTVLGDVRVGLFAMNDIPANSEVTFNYNLECAGIEKKRCLCGAKRCSGYIGAKPKQDESQSKKNKMAAKRTYKKQKPETPPSATKPKPKRPLGRPPKPKELSEIEKDLLIIRNATNGLSSDESCRSLSSEGDRNPKALKRKRVNFSTEEIVLCNGAESPSLKKQKFNEKEVGD